MSNVMDFAGFSLTRLGPEPWGARLTRAREQAGLTIRDVERHTGAYVSRSALSRLEARDVVPDKISDRRKALIVVLLCRVDPIDFDLGPDDVPPMIDLEAVVQANVTSLCFSGRSLWITGGQHVDSMNDARVPPLAA